MSEVKSDVHPFEGMETEDVLKQLIDDMLAPPAKISWRIRDDRWFDLGVMGDETVSIKENNRRYLIHLLEQMKYE